MSIPAMVGVMTGDEVEVYVDTRWYCAIVKGKSFSSGTTWLRLEVDYGDKKATKSFDMKKLEDASQIRRAGDAGEASTGVTPASSDKPAAAGYAADEKPKEATTPVELDHSAGQKKAVSLAPCAESQEEDAPEWAKSAATKIQSIMRGRTARTLGYAAEAGSEKCPEMTKDQLIGELRSYKTSLQKHDPRVCLTVCTTNVDTATVEELRAALERYTQAYKEVKVRMDDENKQFFAKSKLVRSCLRPAGAAAPFQKLPPAAAAAPAPDAAGSGDKQEELDATALIGHGDGDHGLTWNRKYDGVPMGPATEDKRRKVRLGTRTKVANELGIAEFGASIDIKKHAKLPHCCKDVALYSDRSAAAKKGAAAPGGTNLLGRYDAVAVKAPADFDKDFNFMKSKACRNPFWIIHAAALNIGESDKAADYAEYSGSNGLNEQTYLDDMGHVMENITTVAGQHLKGDHLIMFPFGMGAFIRHLRKLDPKFEDDLHTQHLRRALARRFVEALQALPSNMKLHFCLLMIDDESIRNADAFIRALKAAPDEMQKRVVVWPDCCCLQLAIELAAEGDSVIMVNGANRQMIGNHWFLGRARRAIDENIHRRSWTMSAVSYLINRFGGRGEMEGQSPHRDLKECQQNVEAMGGRVVILRQ